MPTASLPLIKTPEDSQAGIRQQDAEKTSFRPATVESANRGYGTLEPSTGSTSSCDLDDRFMENNAGIQHEHQRPYGELFQLAMELKEFYTLHDLQIQGNNDIANQSKELDKKERRVQALKEQVSRKNDQVALHRSKLSDLREALKQQESEIEQKRKNLRLDWARCPN
ncbi:hypothetical protein LTR56_027341 [Elasticomyces elasticus]|nr:hypothetical protein LTR56_027341 [Elasticomyces elasticus]